ncbi:MAG: M28 family peptidase [Gammaproteobacteria bacterium]|nr:M28 family peptidase [Gammaproteobacteria bacterium]MBU2059781.1 M28 family peptidase [Gammaproteobacteria bacterium]MBU2175439.1 M28 family peptidase [Gammaproteobacteria bacterium]MBU2245653.1 M28 family peptidase [Gammaproteobacteria bacterium]MBU2343158.1 M28 family peptidase [Gammaproteobacteria bacterium]
MKLMSISALSAMLVLAGCQSTPTPSSAAALPKASAQAIEAHMTFLGDDSLEGRDTGSRGHQIASNYIATQLAALGLEPAGEQGYFQSVPLRKAMLVQSSAKMSLTKNGKTTDFDYPKQFFTGPSTLHAKADVTAPLVFVGYGLVSKEFNLDDYANLDVKGKIVVMLSGRPKSLPSEEAAHIQSLKAENAAERGAVGIITLHTPSEEKVRPYANSLMYLTSPRMRWLHKDGKAEGEFESLLGSAYVHPDAAKNLFEGAGRSLDDIFADLAAEKVPTGFSLEGTVSLKRESTKEDISSPNVVAVLPGSDPVLKDEYVVVTAHSDHIGFSNDVRSKDKINNGLMDNAAGVGIMLETARLFTQKAGRPKRSILFLAVTGEEKGLLGADYFAHNPTRPIDKLVANVNIDMPVLLYPFADIVAFGANHSSLGATVDTAAVAVGITQSPDPMPEQAIFTRSDHYTLVQQGVPSVFLMTGFSSKDPKQKGGEVWGKFFAKHYHKPTDDKAGLTADFGVIRYDAGAVFADINFGITTEVANNPQRPVWLKDSFFGKIFGKDYNRQK